MTFEEKNKYLNQRCWQIAAALRKQGHYCTLSRMFSDADCVNLFTLVDGKQFSIEYDDHKNRLSISGFYPRGPKDEYIAQPRYGQPANPSIGVGDARPAESIAKAIVSRFFPDFFRRWDEVQKMVDDSTKYLDNLATLRSRVIKTIDGARESEHDDNGVWAKSPYQKIQVSTLHGGLVDLHLDLPVDMAEKVIAIIEDWRRNRPEDDDADL
jgi:hypothetical protein